MTQPSFSPFELKTALLADLSDDPWPTKLLGISGSNLDLLDEGSHYVYCHEGYLSFQHLSGIVTLFSGMYACVPGGLLLSGRHGSGIVITRLGFKGVFSLGGPVEPWGRLRYIDGCTDSLLIPPVKMGDPCLNALFFPPGTDQTAHTHPSMRVGMVIRGEGECVTPEGIIPLLPGQVFIIHQDGLHKFRTAEQNMVVIAYHPDSDFGPQDEDHPMINRTIVDGVSASKIDDIRTAFL
jgi:mannose-6-phosphate isomerase-like protein (cupin superfamily)